MTDINFKPYIRKVQNQVHPDTSITSGALDTLNELVHVITSKVANNVNILLSVSSKATVSSREVQSAVILTLPLELTRRAIGEGDKAVTKLNASLASMDDFRAKYSSGDDNNIKTSKSFRAGLTFSVARAGRLLRKLTSNTRQSVFADVYLAGVLEYLVAEILELAGNVARDDKRVRINNRHIMYAIRGDAALNKLFSSTDTILAGGVVFKPTKADANT